MTRPRTAGDLLSQRPHTTLAGDEEDAAADDDGGDEPDYAPTGYAKADDQLGTLLNNARSADLSLPNYQRFWNSLQSNVIGAAQTMWQLHGPNEDGAHAAGSIVHAGQQVGSHITQLYAKDALGVDFTPFDPGPGIIDRPGIDKIAEYSRPIREKSMTSQLRRLETLANTDLQLSKTRTLFSAFDEDLTVNRAPIRTYRRVTTSEKPCALCEIASDQLYFTTDLMPIHDNCMCDVEMADEKDISEHEARYHHVGFVDTLINAGEQVKALTNLADADADADAYTNLIKIEEHGELGPVIRWSGQKFTGPGDLPNPKGIRPVPTISGPGRGHEARLGRNRTRVAQIRRQRDNLDMRYSPGRGGLSTFVPTPKVVRPIPKPPEPKVAPVIPLRPKGIDFQHDALADIRRGMTAKHTGRVDAWDWEWDDPKYNEDTKRQAMQAFDEILDKYPRVHIGRVGIADLDADTAAETESLGSNDVKSIMFNRSWLQRSPEDLKAGWEKDTANFMFDSAREDPVRQLVWHEFGHAIDQAGGRVARKDATTVVAQAFSDADKGRVIPPNDARPGVVNRYLLEKQDAMRRYLASQMSGYSMVDGILPTFIDPATGRPARMGLASGEAVAQAFSDVELRGDKASDVSKLLHARVMDGYEHPRVTPAWALPGAAGPQPTAVEKLSKLTEPKPDWTPDQLHKEDNHSTNAAGHEILTDENRALAEQLTKDIWISGAKVEPAISASVRASTETSGGFMSGWDFRQKTGPSLYRKIQSEAIQIANGKPVTEDDLRRAADGIKDAVRYTAVMPEGRYWGAGDDLRKALESLGAKTIKDPVGIPLDGYRGRNMAFVLNGTPFEMQVHTELGVAIKDEAHHVYNDSRKLKADLEAKGLVAEDNPTYKKMLDDMQAKWDSMPMLKGTPVVQTEKDAKSGDLNKVMYTMDHTEYQGRTVPNGHAALGSPEMVALERVPSTRYGLDWLPDSPEAKIVAPARDLSADAWNSLPVQHLPPGTHFKANEGTLSKKAIDTALASKDPFSENNPVKLFRTDDGLLHVVDGHTRIAIYNALDKDIPVRIMTQDTINDLQSKDFYDIAKANGGITIDLGGHQPKDGYAFAPRKDTELKLAADKFTDQDVEDFISEHRDLLSKEGNNFGCWYEDGYYYLDVSRVGEASAETIEEAQKNEQIGVFDLKTFDTINIGKIDAQGRYTNLDEATSIHNRHQEQIARDAESRSATSGSEVPRGGAAGAAEVERGAAPPKERASRVRYGPGGPFEAPFPVDSKDLPERGIDFLNHDQLVANILARYNDTVGDKAWIRSAGEQWYPSARGWILKMLDATHSDMPLDKATAIVAQYSENASWTANMARAMNYFTGKPTGAFKATDRRTKAIAESDDPLSMIKGPKVNNFARAILGYDRFPDAVAVDRWAARIALGTDDKDLARTILGRTGGYEALANAYRDAARQLGIPPPELQAVTWVHAVPPDATVEAFKEAGEWHF